MLRSVLLLLWWLTTIRCTAMLCYGYGARHGTHAQILERYAHTAQDFYVQISATAYGTRWLQDTAARDGVRIRCGYVALRITDVAYGVGVRRHVTVMLQDKITVTTACGVTAYGRVLICCRLLVGEIYGYVTVIHKKSRARSHAHTISRRGDHGARTQIRWRTAQSTATRRADATAYGVTRYDAPDCVLRRRRHAYKIPQDSDTPRWCQQIAGAYASGAAAAQESCATALYTGAHKNAHAQKECVKIAQCKITIR